VELGKRLLNQSTKVAKVTDCFDLPIIGQLKRINLEALKLSLFELFGRYNLFFAENARMTSEQINILIEYILTAYINLTIGDMKLICDRLIRSKVFGQLSPNVVIQEMDKYFSERLEIAETESITKHHNKTKKIFDTDDDKMMDAWYENIRKNGVPKSMREIMRKNDKEFQSFKAEYERKKIIENGNS